MNEKHTCPWCGAPTRTVEYVLANSADKAECSDSSDRWRATVFAALGPKETAEFLAGKNAGYWVGVVHIQLCKIAEE